MKAKFSLPVKMLVHDFPAWHLSLSLGRTGSMILHVVM